MGTSRNDDIGKRLLALKQEIEEQKIKRSELQGEQKTLVKQMEQAFGVSTVDQAQELLANMELEIKELEEKVKKGIQEIERIMREGEEE
jgi:ribosomal protein S20